MAAASARLPVTRLWWSDRRPCISDPDKIFVASTDKEIEDLWSLHFSNEKVIGIDSEFFQFGHYQTRAYQGRPGYFRRSDDACPERIRELLDQKKDAAAIVQISSKKGVTLIIPATATKDLGIVKRALEDPSILKIGQTLQDNDAPKIFAAFGVKLCGTIEVADMVAADPYYFQNKRIKGLKDMLHTIFHARDYVPGYDGKFQSFTVNWLGPLSKTMRSYAAADAQGCLDMIYVISPKVFNVSEDFAAIDNALLTSGRFARFTPYSVPVALPAKPSDDTDKILSQAVSASRTFEKDRSEHQSDICFRLHWRYSDDPSLIEKDDFCFIGIKETSGNPSEIRICTMSLDGTKFLSDTFSVTSDSDGCAKAWNKLSALLLVDHHPWLFCHPLYFRTVERGLLEIIKGAQKVIPANSFINGGSPIFESKLFLRAASDLATGIALFENEATTTKMDDEAFKGPPEHMEELRHDLTEFLIANNILGFGRLKGATALASAHPAAASGTSSAAGSLKPSREFVVPSAYQSNKAAAEWPIVDDNQLYQLLCREQKNLICKSAIKRPVKKTILKTIAFCVRQRCFESNLSHIEAFVLVANTTRANEFGNELAKFCRGGRSGKLVKDAPATVNHIKAQQPNVIVCRPLLALKCLNSQELDCSRISLIIIMEADEIMARRVDSSAEDLREIVSRFNADKDIQIVMISRTYSGNAEEICEMMNAEKCELHTFD